MVRLCRVTYLLKTHPGDRYLAQRFWYIVDTVLILVAGTILIAAILHVTADVVMKHFFSRPIPGTIVYVSNYYMTMIVFLPLASAELRNQHIVVDLWQQQAPWWLDNLLLRFSWAFSSSIYFLVAWNTMKDAIRKHSEGQYVLDQSGFVTTWQSYYVLPIGIGLLAALLAFKVLNPNLSVTSPELQPNG